MHNVESLFLFYIQNDWKEQEEKKEEHQNKGDHRVSYYMYRFYRYKPTYNTITTISYDT